MRNNKPNKDKTSDWVLRPSTSIPGKYYYFNTQNAESVWCMDDEKVPSRVKCKNNIENTPEKSQNYSNSNIPPIQIPQASPSRINQVPKQPNFHPNPSIQQPSFGQAVFPKYMTNIDTCMPNIVWMPVPCPTPIILPSTVKVPMFDQITQTSDPKQTFVQTTGKPMCERFTNHEEPVIHFNKNNKIIDRSIIKKYQMSIPIKKFNSKQFQIQNSKQFQIQNCDVPNSKEFIKKPLLKSDILNIQVSRNISSSRSWIFDGNSALSSCDKVENRDTGIYRNTQNKDTLANLQKNDLRHLLVGKQKKSLKNDDYNGLTEPKKSKSTFEDQGMQKKRVTFDLTDLLDNVSDEESANVTPTEHNLNALEHNQDLEDMGPESNTDIWYLVADTDVLLEEYNFINEFVLSDKNCKLLIPQAVRSDIEAMTLGESRGRQHVIVARQLARLLDSPPPHYIVEPEYSYSLDSMYSIDRVLDSCLKAINGNRPVMLISNDPRLHNKAKLHNVPCYKIEDIKNSSFFSKPAISFDHKNIKITIDNNNENHNIINYNFSNEHNISVDSYKNQLFTEEGSNNIIAQQNSIFDCESDSTYDITCLKNLNLKENQYQSTTISNSTIPNLKSPIPIQNTIAKSCYKKPDAFHIQSTNCDGSFLFQNAAACLVKTTDIRNSNPFTFCNTNAIEDVQIKNNTDSSKETNIFEQNNSKFISNDSNSKTSLFQSQNNKTSAIKNQNSDVPVSKEQIVKDFDEKLKKFCVKNEIVQEKLKRRMDEWICTYTQIMDEALCDLYQRTDIVKSKKPPRWSLYEAITCMKDLYGDDHTMEILTEGFIQLLHSTVERVPELLNNNYNEKKVEIKMEPEDFMKMLGCGVLLVKHLETILPDKQQLYDAEDSLYSLLNTIENYPDGNTVLLEIPVCRSQAKQDASETRSYFKKEKSYIIDYLKKHYKEWESNDSTAPDKNIPQEPTPPEMKIVRTCGKNLNMLKIDNDKSITLLKTTIDNTNGTTPNTGPISNRFENIKLTERFDFKNIETAVRKPMKINQNDSSNIQTKKTPRQNKNNEPKMMQTIANNTTKNDSKITQTHLPINSTISCLEAEITGPKVIRNMKVIDKYEDRIKNKEPLDLDILDHSKIRTSLTEISDKPLNEIEKNNAYTNEFKNPSNATNSSTKNEITNKESRNDKLRDPLNDVSFNDKVSVNDDSLNDTDIMQVSLNEDCTNDSGFENESTHAHSLVKLFLTELSGSLKVTHEFIDQFIKESSGSELSEDKKKLLHDKAVKSLEVIGVIIQKLKSIINRDSNEDTELKNLLMNAGVEAVTDKRITRYRQVVTKCLEQTQILSNGLKLMVSLTGDMDDISFTTDSLSMSIGYFNIFE